MDSILPSDQYTEVEGRFYVNPQTGLEESSTFIDKLREAQVARNQEITRQTQALGTNIPSVQGGLTGSESYFTSRYQTPQNISAVANLRATAQAQALNEALANEEAMWKKRYQDAYKDYQQRQYVKANTPTYISRGGGGGGYETLELDTNIGGDETQEVSVYTGGEYQSGKMYPVTDYVSDYKDASGQWWQIGNPTQRDISFGPANNPFRYKQVNENVVTVNGQDYIYLDNIPNRSAAWYPVTRSAGPGTYSPYAGA